MKHKTTTEEAESPVDKKPFLRINSLGDLLLWFITGFVLIFIPILSFIYYLLRKGPKSIPQQEKISTSQSLNLEQKKTMGEVRRNEVSDKPILEDDQKFPFMLPLSALVIGVVGQFMLRENQILIGVIFMGLAIFGFVIPFRKHPGPGGKLTAEPLVRQQFIPKWSFWGVIALGLAILFAGLAFWLFGTSYHPIYPWTLHLSSIGLLILSSLWMNKFKQPVWTRESQQNGKGDWTWLTIGILLAILVIAAFMRLYRFDQIPFGLWYDEADNGLSALRILNEPGYLPVFVQSTHLPAHFLYLIAFFFKALGVSPLTLRLISVVFGLATVAASFFLGYELFNSKLGLVLAFFLAVSRWDVNWSRIGMHGVSVPFFEIISAALILRALRKQRVIDYSLAGISLGLGLCFYTPLYLFPVVIVIFLLYLGLYRRDLLLSSWYGFLFILLGIIIASIPISQYAIRQTDSFSDRVGVTSIFTGKSQQEAWIAVAKTTREHLLMFNFKGDRNGRHNLPGEPMLDPIVGALLVLGVGLSLWRIRQPGSFLLIAWLLLMLLPGIFSLDFESPQSLRAIGSLPPAYLLAVVPIHALWRHLEQFKGKRSASVFIPLLIFVLIGVGYINYNIYFNQQAKNSATWSAFSTPETIVGKTMAELGPQVDPYVSIFYYQSPTIQFLSPEITEYHSLQTYESLPIQTDGKKTMMFFVDPDRKPFFLQAQQYYPDADFKEYQAPDGTVVLYQITLKPSDIAATQGITASYYRDANWLGQPFLVRKEAAIDIDWKDGYPAPFPFGVKWDGLLCVDQYGVYRFILQSPSPSELYLDNVQNHLAGEGDQTVEIELAEGCHDLILKTMGKEGHFELDWQPPDKKQEQIPSSYLFLPPISNNGLLGKYFSNGNWQGPPAFTKIDPWIHFYYQEQPLPRPYTVEWVGKINISKGGLYRFALDSIDESTLFIDDSEIINIVTNEYREREVDLSPGFHTIRLRYADRTGYTHVNLNWAPPNSELETIPQNVLFPP